MSPTRPSKREARTTARKRELLEAALQMFVERGFAATSTAEVGARAGGSLYLYYKSKEELLRAVISAYSSSAISAGRARVRQHRGPAAKLLLESLTQWWQEIYDGPASAVIKLIMTEARNFPDLANFYQQEVIEPGEQIVAEVVKRGITSGEFRSMNVDNTVRSLLYPVILLCVHKHSLSATGAGMAAIDFQSFVRGHVALMLHGMTSTGPAPSRQVES